MFARSILLFFGETWKMIFNKAANAEMKKSSAWKTLRPHTCHVSGLTVHRMFPIRKLFHRWVHAVTAAVEEYEDDAVLINNLMTIQSDVCMKFICSSLSCCSIAILSSVRDMRVVRSMLKNCCGKSGCSFPAQKRGARKKSFPSAIYEAVSVLLFMAWI